MFCFSFFFFFKQPGISSTKVGLFKISKELQFRICNHGQATCKFLHSKKGRTQVLSFENWKLYWFSERSQSTLRGGCRATGYGNQRWPKKVVPFWKLRLREHIHLSDIYCVLFVPGFALGGARTNEINNTGLLTSKNSIINGKKNFFLVSTLCQVGFPGGAGSKEPTCQCRRGKRQEFNPGSRRSPGEGHGNPLQYSCLENRMERGAWWATVHSVAKSQTQLKRLSTQAHMCAKHWDECFAYSISFNISNKPMP